MADISVFEAPNGSEYNFKDTEARAVMTGAGASTAGSAGRVPAPAAGDNEKFLRGDGTWVLGGRPMVILSYGNSTWSDFITAYNNNVIVYCRASSNSNPATGSQTRMAFMAYVSNATSPTEVEFQYYRSVSTHSDSQQGDQVYVYKLNSSGTWTVTMRSAFTKIVAGTNLSSSYANGVLTLTGNYSAMTGADGTNAGTTGLVPAPAASDNVKFLKGDGTWADVDALPAVTSSDNGKALVVASGAWSVGTIDALPAVTSSDNGKVLRVVQGGWSAATYPAANQLLPAPPMNDGTYFLQCSVSSGSATYSWVTIPAANGVSF